MTLNLGAKNQLIMRQFFLKCFCLLGLTVVVGCRFFDDQPYAQLTEQEFQALTIQKKLVSRPKYQVVLVGDSLTDATPRLAVTTQNHYLLDWDCYLENDSTVLAYEPAFIIDEEGEFRKNGLWVYIEFYNEGTFPFHTKCKRFHVDSIPPNWNKKVPQTEGIYFYEAPHLRWISKKQSNEKLEEIAKNGFYFLPNSGRLFERIPLSSFE